MSGGALNYAYNRINDAAHDIRERIVREPFVDEYGTHHDPHPPQVIAAFERAALLCEIAASAAMDVEWLESGDTSEESFIQESLEWTPERVADMLAGRTSFKDIGATTRAHREAWRVANEWIKDRWNYADSRWNEPSDEATATRWRCYDDVKAILWIHDVESLDDIRPLSDLLADAARLAEQWAQSDDPVLAKCGAELAGALKEA